QRTLKRGADRSRGQHLPLQGTERRRCCKPRQVAIRRNQETKKLHRPVQQQQRRIQADETDEACCAKRRRPATRPEQTKQGSTQLRWLPRARSSLPQTPRSFP